MCPKNSNNNTNKSSLFIYDERVQFVLGLFLLFFAAFLTFAFISYFFTWKADQSFEWGEAISGPNVTVDNWAGKTGAKLANLFIFKLFGIASFFIPLMMIVGGLRLINIKTFRLTSFIRGAMIGLLFLSIVLGFISGKLNGYLGSGLGGHYGYSISAWLNAFIGKFGTGLLLSISVITYVIFLFPSSYQYCKKQFYKITGREAEFDEDSTVPVQDTVDAGTDEQDTKSTATESETDLVFETEKINEDDTGNYNYQDVEGMNDKQEEDQNHSDSPSSEDKDVQLTVEEQKAEENAILNENISQMEDYDPTLDLSNYKLPPLDLLEKHESNNFEVSDEELIGNKNKIVETFANFKIQINKIKATIGPTVTLYEIVPAPGIRISKIKNLEDDIALSLAALGIRIIAPIPGKGTVGIEVPNQHPQIVSMRSILNSRKFQEAKHDLSIAIGKTISNETFVFDLAKMPHLLVAGATGQGKSVGLNAILTSLLYKKHPAQLKFVLIDPKKVELSVYSKIEKHFLAKLPDDSEEAIITDTQKVITTLHSLTVEMDNRYSLLKQARVRNITEYNQKFIARKLNPENGHRYMPFIIVVIDEFADLIMTAGKEVESPIARLAQLARAIGIHLIIATQRPTTNIITGVIKANFPARIAFKVTSMIDSRTILDSPGANQLIGRGDMLITSGNDLVRVQCAFVDISEIEALTDFIGTQQGYPSAMVLPEYKSDDDEDKGEIDLSKRDGLFEEAARLVVVHQQGSTSLIQRKFSIGYNRAGRIVDQLEAAQIVGPFEGSKARKVLIPDEYTLEQHINSL